MRERTEAIQRMLDWIEAHVTENPSLLDMSRQIGYSPSHCSALFHQVTGMTVKQYASRRRLAIATLALRDTDARILDIALDAGFGSQEALTRAFSKAYGVTPRAYRIHPGPIPLPMPQVVLFPEDVERMGEEDMQKTVLTDAGVRVEYIPAHKYIGIWDPTVDEYMDFWEHHDCDMVTGTIESMRHVEDPVVTAHTAGWYDAGGGKRGYFYGLGVPEDYAGDIPEGFEVKSVPGSYYLVFYHPAFDFIRDCGEVMRRVEKRAADYDPKDSGFAWSDTGPMYQRHIPETIGYEVLRPVKAIGR